MSNAPFETKSQSKYNAKPNQIKEKAPDWQKEKVVLKCHRASNVISICIKSCNSTKKKPLNYLIIHCIKITLYLHLVGMQFYEKCFVLNVSIANYWKRIDDNFFQKKILKHFGMHLVGGNRPNPIKCLIGLQSNDFYYH